METSVLTSTKLKLGVDPDYDAFDHDIITFINATFSTLTQLGVGPPVFQITDASVEWSTYLDDDVLLNLVQTYMYLKVRMLFDPPATSYTQAMFEKQLEQFEWRISVYREGSDWIDPTVAANG